MSRLSTAFSTLKSLASCAVESPRCTMDAFKLLPAVARGLQYGRLNTFPAPPRPADSSPASPNPLRDYFDAHTEGPGLWKWLHYFDIYHRHFEKFVGREVQVLEVGIYSGGSLAMWRNYFGDQCRIYGVDIAPACLSYKAEGIEVFIGDQSDRAFWKKFREQVPRVDILIDDGGHAPEQQRITLEEMLPHIQAGGVYLCEDVGGSNNPFAAFVAGLANNLHDASRREGNRTADIDAPVIPSALQASVSSVHLYPLVTVIEKHEQDPGQFISRKQGTQWQPF
jgi:hypothetical protein